MKCSQEDCEEDAAYRFTWPGQPEAGICNQHVHQLKATAEAMGFYLQLLPVEK